MISSLFQRTHAIALMLAASLGLAACGSLAPGRLPPGTPIDQARHMIFAPTGEYALRDGATRLEFSQGRETFMLDFDKTGTLVSNQQVLDLPHFAEIKPGMSDDDVRIRLGRPVQVFGVGWQRLQYVWNYRYWGGDCVWFQVSIDAATRRVTEAGNGSDPACDAKGARDS